MFKKRYLLAALLLLVYASVALAAGAPTVPYRGSVNTSISQTTLPTAVENYFWDRLPAAAKNYDMPTFTVPGWSQTTRGANEYGRATSTKQMIDYLNALPKDNMQMRFVSEILTYNVGSDTPEDLGMPLRAFQYPLLVFTKEGVFDPEDVKALGRPILLFEGAIHGNEQAATEAMLPLAKRLATPGEDLNALLDKVSVIIIPRYNVDGVWKNTRTGDSLQVWHYTTTANADAQNTNYTRINGLDQNRDQTGFESPITRVVNQIWNAYEPHFISDGHQQGVTIGTAGWNPGIALLYTSNPNTPEHLDELVSDGITTMVDKDNPATWTTTDAMERIVMKALKDDGLDWTLYRGSGSTVGQITGQAPYEYYTGSVWANANNYTLRLGGFQEGNPEEGITDTAGRLMGAFGLLAEISSPAQGNVGPLYHYRIRTYETTCAAIITLFADPVRGPILKKGVDDARVAMATATSVRKGVDPKDIVVAIRNAAPVPLEDEMPGIVGLPVVRLVRNPYEPTSGVPVVSRDILPTHVSRSRRVEAQDESILPHSTVKRPTAYIISCDALAAARIAYTGVKIERLAEPVTVPVEYYTVRSFKQSHQYFAGSQWPTSVPQLSVAIASVDKGNKNMSFAKDTFVVFMDQYKAPHAAMTMEPAGARNFGNYWYSRVLSKKNGFLPVALNQDFPAYRYMGDASNLKTYFAGSIHKMPFVTGTHIEWPFLPTNDEINAFTKDVLNAGNELLSFTGFIVNQHVGALTPSNDTTTGEPLFYDYSFKAYLNKIPNAEAWYVWDWQAKKAVKIEAGADGYAQLAEENIGPDFEVFMFCVAQNDILSLFKDGKLPGGAVLTDKGIKYTDIFDNKGTILNDSMFDGWKMIDVSPKSGTNWSASIVNGELVVKFTGDVFNQVVTVTLQKTGTTETKTMEVEFSGEKDSIWNRIIEEAGCNAGFALLALLAFCPLILRRK